MNCSSRVLCVTVLIAAVSVLSAAELPEGFRLEPIISGLTDPSAVAAASDGSLLIAERSTGDLRMVRMGELLPGAVCHVDVETSGEAGLLGVAAHPAFSSNHWVYLYYTDAASGKNKVTRYELNGTSCSSPTTIVADLGGGANFLNNGGGLAFGPDGTLFIGTGDVEVPSSGQDDLVLQGKILRLEADGSIPADNPTPGSAVYALGVRNGSSVAVGAAGQVYGVDQGNISDSSLDEINPVPAGGNLGWDSANGDSGGVFDDPLVAMGPVKRSGLAVYGAQAFPDLDNDGIDNDFDRFGPDHFPGRPRRDDNGQGVCLGSTNYENPCTSVANCPPRPAEFTSCFMEDEDAEWCPGGTPINDDDCNGIDEPDESFLNNLFVAAPNGDAIERFVVEPADPTTMSEMSIFLDSRALSDCPTGFSGVTGGNDGQLYAVATNGGGAAGALYRIVFDPGPGPREVSGPGSHFPLKLTRGTSPGDLVIDWEDLRDDAKQPRDNGTDPLPWEREYTVWSGTIGDFTTHAPINGLEAAQGSPVNDALRRAEFTPDSGSVYFLVSGRGDNLEGPLGSASNGTPRTGYAVTDLCDSIGYHYSGNGWALWTCGRDFTLQDEHGETQTLSDLRGKPLMLDLSAVWCGPCHSEADILEAFYQSYKDRDVNVLTVLMDDEINGLDWVGRPSFSECRAWGNRAPNPSHTFPCWADPDPQTAWPRYNAHGALPTNLVLDSGGRVVYTGGGFASTTIQSKLDAMVGTTATCVH